MHQFPGSKNAAWQFWSSTFLFLQPNCTCKQWSVILFSITHDDDVGSTIQRHNHKSQVLQTKACEGKGTEFKTITKSRIRDCLIASSVILKSQRKLTKLPLNIFCKKIRRWSHGGYTKTKEKFHDAWLTSGSKTVGDVYSAKQVS